MERDEILAMTPTELRRFARRTAKRALGTVQLEHVQDVRQPAATDRREGWYRGQMAALLTDAGRVPPGRGLPTGDSDADRCRARAPVGSVRQCVGRRGGAQAPPVAPSRPEGGGWARPMGRRKEGGRMRYSLYLDVVGVATEAPASFRIGDAGSWRELHWMARGAKPLERGGRLRGHSEDGRVLYASDLEQEHDPHIGESVTDDLEALVAARAVAERRGFGTDVLDTYIRGVEDLRVDDGRDDDPDAGADLQTLEAAGDVLAGRGFTREARGVRDCIAAIKRGDEAPEDAGAPLRRRYEGKPVVLSEQQTCASCGDTLTAGTAAVRFDEGDTRYVELPAFTCDALRCFQSLTIPWGA